MILVIMEAKIVIMCDSQEDYSDSGDRSFIDDSELDDDALFLF